MLLANTKQELFDLAFNGIVNQGGPAVGDNGCSYETDTGRRCAASHCLTDEIRTYALKHEQAAGNGLLDIEGLVEIMTDDEMEMPDDELLTFMDRLQVCHDRLATEQSEQNQDDAWYVARYTEHMELLAYNNKLSFAS